MALRVLTNEYGRRAPDDLEERLGELTADELDALSQKAEHIAEKKRRQQQVEEKENKTNETEPELDRHGDEMPEGVPSKASLTVETINGNDYYY